MLWRLFVWSATVFNAVSTPLLLAFGGQNYTFFYSAIFFLDIILTLRTTAIENGKIITSPTRLWKRYVYSWDFFFDFFTSIPFYEILTIAAFSAHVDDTTIVLLRPVSCIKLLRMFRVRGFSSSLNPYMRLTNLMFVFFIIAHIFACTFIFIGKVEHETNQQSWFHTYKLDNSSIVYLTALYWSIVTLTTTGYGDIVCTTPGERLLCIPALLVALLLQASLVGTICFVVETIQMTSRERYLRVDAARVFARNLPPKLRDTLVRYTTTTFSQTRGINEEEVLSVLPASIRAEVALQTHRYFLMTCKCMLAVDPYMQMNMASLFKTTIVLRGDYACVQGQVAHELFFVEHGILDVNVTGSGVVAQVYPDSQFGFFGEIALLSDEVRTASVIATENCFLLTLTSNDIKDISANTQSIVGEMLRRAAIYRLQKDIDRTGVDSGERDKLLCKQRSLTRSHTSHPPSDSKMSFPEVVQTVTKIKRLKPRAQKSEAESVLESVLGESIPD